MLLAGAMIRITFLAVHIYSVSVLVADLGWETWTLRVPLLTQFCLG